MQYSKEDIQNFNNKDYRMAFENALKSYASAISGCGGNTECLKAIFGNEYEELIKLGITRFSHLKTDELFIKYPIITKEIPTGEPHVSGNYAPKREFKKFTKPEVSNEYKCNFCHASLVKTKDGSAYRCPNWKKDGSGCKGTYVKPEDIARANHTDSITDEASHIPTINEGEEYDYGGRETY